MATIGKLRYNTGEFDFEWHIEHYSSYASCCSSPPFSFAGEPWCLAIFPSGRSNINSQKCVCLYLIRKTSGPPISLTWSWGLKTFDGKKDHESQCKFVFKNCSEYGTAWFVDRSTLSEKKSELLRNDVLNIFCTVQCHSRTSNDIAYTLEAMCPYCNKESASSHEHKCLDKPIRCPTCSDVVALREWFNHECEAARIKGRANMHDEVRSGQPPMMNDELLHLIPECPTS